MLISTFQVHIPRPSVGVAFTGLLVLLFAVYSSSSLAGDSAPKPPNWDRELAIQSARDGGDEQLLYEWFSLLRKDGNEQLVDSVRQYSESTRNSAPVRERHLLLFTLGLGDFPETNIPSELVELLSSYTPQTLVLHEESSTNAVPLFNIPAAVQGLKYDWQRQDGRTQSMRLLETNADSWIQAYRFASPAEQRGFLDVLQDAQAAQLVRISEAAINTLAAAPELSTVIGTAALHAKDIAVLEEAVRHPENPDLAPLLRNVAVMYSKADRSRLLLTAIESAPPENAALVLALLAPGLHDSPAITDTLFHLLDDAELGSSAALALSRHPDPGVISRLGKLAGNEGVSARRARLALGRSDDLSGAEQ